MSKVAFVKVKTISKENVEEQVWRAMELADWKKYVKGKKIFFKINGISDQLVPGQCTSPWVLEAVVKKFRKEFPNKKYYMGDADLAAARQLNDAAKIWGFKDIANKYDVEFVNLSEQPLVKQQVGGKVFKELDLPKILIDVDTIINIPVMKSHCLTQLTCCLKNHWGMVPRVRHQFHLVANQAIPDINKYFKKTRFNIVDGTIVMEGNAPRTGITKICNVIFAGPDRVALDYMVGKYMGFDADSIKHIEVAENDGIGSRKDIEMVGDTFYINPFVKPNPDQQPIFFWEMRLRKVPVVKPLLFDTPIFSVLSYIATKYNTFWWYRKRGIEYIREVLRTPYSREFAPLLEKAGIKM